MRKLSIAQRMERALLGMRLADRMKNTEIRRRSGVSDIIEQLSKLKRKWARHGVSKAHGWEVDEKTTRVATTC